MTTENAMTDATERPDGAGPGKPSRFWLFAPCVLLLGLAAAWCAAWFVVRSRTVAALDAWVAAERANGRDWSCPDRSVGGFPFRIAVECPSLSLTRSDLAIVFGRGVAVAQVYQPRLIIAEASGPLRLNGGTVDTEATWRLMQASIRTTPGGFERVSVVLDEPRIRVTGLGGDDMSAMAKHLETHLRPGPTQGTSNSYQANLRLDGATSPELAALLGPEPADVTVDAKVSPAAGNAAGSLVEAVERWREAGGRIELDDLRFAKGPTRLQGTGELALDELHRPTGRIEASGAGIEGLLGPLMGPRAGLIGVLLAGAKPSKPLPSAAPELKPLPPLKLEGGRVFLGPLALPNVRLAPLY